MQFTLPESAPMVEHALEMASQGLWVFPLQHGSKIPFKGTNGFLDASITFSTIRKDFEERGEANVGIATGQSQLVVVDVDPRHGGDDSWATLCRNFNKFDTLEQQTGGGGRQLFFKADPAYNLTSTSNSFGDKFSGIDLRAQGGYVVAPPSLHESGRRYLWDAGASDLCPLPRDIAEFLFEQQAILREIPKQALVGKVKEGNRNKELTRVAGLLRRHGLSSDMMFPSLNYINKQACVPPLPEREVWLICNSIGRKAPEHELFSLAPTLRMVIKSTADLRSTRQEWLLDGYIPRAELTIFEGRGGLGKSTTALDILSRLSSRRVLPGGSRPEHIERSLLIAEEDSGSLIRSRLQAAHADLLQVFILDGLSTGDDDDTKLPFQVPRDLEQLKQVIQEHKFNVVYIDALFNCFEKRYSANSSQDVRVVVGGLAKLAHDTGCTIIVTRHVGKADRHDKDRGLGSVDIGNVARSVVLFDEIEEGSPTRRLHISKHNYGNQPPDLLYEFEPVTTYDNMGKPMEVAKVKWIGLTEFEHTNENIFTRMKEQLDG